MTYRGLGEGYTGLMQNRGSALIFLFVLFVMCLGTYAAISTFMKGGGTDVIALETLTPTAEAEMTAASSTPAPTNTPLETPTPHSEVSTPVAPTPTPIPPVTPTSPPPPTPTLSPAPTTVPATPTPVPPVGGRLFGVIRNEQDCSAGGYIRGMVYDADGAALSGINIRLYSNQGYDERAQSKAGAIDLGAYDFPMGPDAARFYLEIVDNLGNPLSGPEVVEYRPDCTSYVDWRSVQ
jgi:hypothetical protein